MQATATIAPVDTSPRTKTEAAAAKNESPQPPAPTTAEESPSSVMAAVAAAAAASAAPAVDDAEDPSADAAAAVPASSSSSSSAPAWTIFAGEQQINASPFTQKTLDSLRVEIGRAEADENDVARELRQQYEALLQKAAAASPASTSEVAVPSDSASKPSSPDVADADATTAASASTSSSSSSSSSSNNNNNADDAEPFVLDKADEHINEVVPGLFIGDITAAVDGKRLSAAGVTHVVDLANTICGQNRPERNVNYVVPKESGDWADTCPSVLSKLVVKVDDVDEAPLDEHFDAINDFIRSAVAEGGVAFVHCFRGKSRSATSVIQYLMQVGAVVQKLFQNRRLKEFPSSSS
jgi:hypothetical protein